MAENLNQPGILIEWSSSGGREQISTTKAIGAAGGKLTQAMDTILAIADQARSTAQTIADTDESATPQGGSLKTLEFEFGLKFDAEAGAFLAKAGIEASISVKMVWEA